MNLKKAKYWAKTQKGKNIWIPSLAVFITFIIMLMILLTVVFSVETKSKYPEVIAYNRDSNSGTRDAFEESINFDSSKQTFSENVLQVSSNDSMIDKVQKNTQTIGYVSLSTILEEDENGNLDYLDNINVLNLNGVDPLEDYQNQWANYSAKRYFNVFFRVDKDYSEFIYANSYMGYKNGDYLDNLWSENGTIQNVEITNSQNQQVEITLDSLFEEYNVGNDLLKQAHFMYSFLYYNWFISSQNVFNYLMASTSIDDPLFQEGLENFIGNVYELNPKLFNLDVDDGTDPNSNVIGLYTLGSTSVTSSISISIKGFNEDINLATQANGIETKQSIIVISQNNGSGDAFKDDPSTSDEHFWLGFQSRSPEESEFNSWGYTSSDIFPTNGTENQYSGYDTVIYSTFEIDALVFITNSKQTIDVVLDGDEVTIKPTNITTIGLNMIYTQNTSFEELYYLNLLDGEKV